MQASKYFTHKLDQYFGNPSVIEERDACGVGFLVDIKMSSSHSIILQALNSLQCMEHRGACGADCVSGDGSGITTQIPWLLFKNTMPELNFDACDSIGVAMLFLPHNYLTEISEIVNWLVKENGFELLCWRLVPVSEKRLGSQALENKPIIKQCFVKSELLSGDELERKLYILRKKLRKQLLKLI